MNKALIPLVVLSAMLALGAGAWIAWTTASTNADIVTKENTPKAAATPSATTFSPPVGAGNHTGSEGPWARRLLGAYSDDGLTWTKTNTVITDQADVPSLVVDDAGTVFMYYYGWTVGSRQNLPAVATSEDDGETWTFHYLQFSGFPGRGDVSDPDVVYEDGVFRIFGTSRDGGNAHILYGEGTDGIAFTYKGVAFQPNGLDAGVASVYRVGDTWNMYSLASLGMSSKEESGKHWFATSTNGTSFTQDSSVYFRVGNEAYFNGNVIPISDGYQMYLFSEGGNGIRSWLSTDGKTWELEDGIRLTLDPSSGKEMRYVGDPDIVRLPDGRFFMVYATLIP